MARVKISAHAKSDLRGIYRYGYRNWGKSRADEFQISLHLHFKEIAKNPNCFPVTTKFLDTCRKSVFRKYSIYFNVLDDYVEILAVVRYQDLSQRFPYKHNY